MVLHLISDSIKQICTPKQTQNVQKSALSNLKHNSFNRSKISNMAALKFKYICLQI